MCIVIHVLSAAETPPQVTYGVRREVDRVHVIPAILNLKLHARRNSRLQAPPPLGSKARVYTI